MVEIQASMVLWHSVAVKVEVGTPSLRVTVQMWWDRLVAQDRCTTPTWERPDKAMLAELGIMFSHTQQAGVVVPDRLVQMELKPQTEMELAEKVETVLLLQ
jgi:hypothetical protein